jgi:hypothetical protein
VGWAVKKLTIKYVDRLPRQSEELPPNLVEIYMRVSKGNVELCIVRHGFIAANHVFEAIDARFRRLAARATENHRTLAERIGLAPSISAEWHEFLKRLLQREDSWAFLVPPNGLAIAS